MNPALFLYISLPAFALGFILGWFCHRLNRAQKRAGYLEPEYAPLPYKCPKCGDSQHFRGLCFGCEPPDVPGPLQAAQERLNRVDATDELADASRKAALWASPYRPGDPLFSEDKLQRAAIILETAAFRRAADERAVKAEDNSPKHTS